MRTKSGPWVALLYTDIKNRNQGFGEMFLKKIQELSNEMGFNELYLYTFTTENFQKGTELDEEI